MIEPPPPRQADEEHWTPLVVLEADHEAAEHARVLKEAWRKPRYEWVAGEIMEIHPSHPPTFSVRNSESDTIERKVPGHRVRVNVDVRARRFKSKRAKARDKEGADGALEKLFEVLVSCWEGPFGIKCHKSPPVSTRINPYPPRYAPPTSGREQGRRAHAV